MASAIYTTAILCPRRGALTQATAGASATVAVTQLLLTCAVAQDAENMARMVLFGVALVLALVAFARPPPWGMSIVGLCWPMSFVAFAAAQWVELGDLELIILLVASIAA